MAIRKAVATAFASEARTAAPTDYTLTFGNDGISVPSMDNLANMQVVVDVTAVAGTASITPAINGVDPLSGESYSLLSGISAISTVSTAVYRIGRNIDAVAGESARDMIPPNVEISVGHGNTDSITYSVTVIGEFETVQ